MRTFAMCALCLATLLAGCSKPIHCPVCYEDEWSRDPFPGQPKQQIPPLSREDAQKMEQGVPAPAK